MTDKIFYPIEVKIYELTNYNYVNNKLINCTTMT